MSRLGIRRRLRSFLGKDSASPVQTTGIRFRLPDGTEQDVEVEANYTLAMASQLLESPVDQGCPDGECGGCVVDILEGAVSLKPTSDREKTAYKMKYEQLMPDGERLACHARIAESGAVVAIRRVWRLDEFRGE